MNMRIRGTGVHATNTTHTEEGFHGTTNEGSSDKERFRHELYVHVDFKRCKGDWKVNRHSQGKAEGRLYAVHGQERTRACVLCGWKMI